MPTVIETTNELGADLADWAGDDDRRTAVAATVRALAAAGIRIADLVARGDLDGPLSEVVGATPEGDAQKRIDVLTDDVVTEELRRSPVAVIGSEERDDPVVLDPTAPLAVAIDPLDGSGNVEVGAPIGTIFSVLPATADAVDTFTQPGERQLAAGYVLFGAATTLVMTVRDGTDVYVLDRERGEFVRTVRAVRMPQTAKVFAVNVSNRRHWPDAVQAYVDDLLDGSEGPRGRDYNMRWLAAVVAEVHRIVLQGGIYLYPGDARPGYEEGRLRLVYEANPIALLMEEAGGAATDGRTRILELVPRELHQRTPLVFGSVDKVELVARYLDGEPFRGERSPLFGARGLFRPRG